MKIWVNGVTIIYYDSYSSCFSFLQGLIRNNIIKTGPVQIDGVWYKLEHIVGEVNLEPQNTVRETRPTQYVPRKADKKKERKRKRTRDGRDAD